MEMQKNTPPKSNITVSKRVGGRQKGTPNRRRPMVFTEAVLAELNLSTLQEMQRNITKAIRRQKSHRTLRSHREEVFTGLLRLLEGRVLTDNLYSDPGNTVLLYPSGTVLTRDILAGIGFNILMWINIDDIDTEAEVFKLLREFRRDNPNVDKLKSFNELMHVKADTEVKGDKNAESDTSATS